MASESQRSMLAKLPRSLQGCAIDLSDEGSAEYAFPVSSAKEVFDRLVIAGLAILGGDLWEVDAVGFAPCYENWYSESADGADVNERWREFLARIPGGDTFYVTFVVRSN